MKTISLAILIILFGAHCVAQKEVARYNEHSTEIQNEIWQDTSAAFQVKEIPAELNNESAVIIAKSFEIVNTTTVKHQSFFGQVEKINYQVQVTLRQRVKINDKNALEKYSSIEYVKNLDRGISFMFYRIKNEVATYVGAKVIKPGGTETIINSGEEVLIKNEKKDKEAKLVIPGLQVGDIIDYYIKQEAIVEGSVLNIRPFTFFMNENYPVIYYSINLRLDPESSVKYVSANGAPFLNESRNADGDIILKLTQTNLSKFNDYLFTSRLRQYPYISLQYQIAKRGTDANFIRGEVQQGSRSMDLANQLVKGINRSWDIKKYYPLTIAQDYFGGADKMKDIPKDSVVKALYNAWRYWNVSGLFKSSQIKPDIIKYSNASSIYNAVYFSKILATIDIENTIYLVQSRNSGNLENIMNITDCDALIKVKADKDYWLSLDDIFTQFHEIPICFQGEEAITLQSDKTSGIVYYTVGRGKVPITIPAYNSISEKLDVSFDSLNMEALQVKRSCKQTGGLRYDAQRKLLLTEDIEKNIAAAVAPKKPLEQELSADRLNQLNAEFSTERNNLKASFEEEINDHFKTKLKNLTAYQIIEPGLYSYSIPFEYGATFTLENYVKKAGSNFILEVGELIGNIQKVDEMNRRRSLDVYFPCPMSYSWAINVSIPYGFDVRGIEDLNKIVNNETGSFSCMATNEGHSVNIKINIVYAHNFEKSSNWPKILEIKDALNNFNTQKILLEKN